MTKLEKMASCDEIIATLTDLIHREQFDIVGESLDKIWTGQVAIDWDTPSAHRLVDFVAGWIAEICSYMYREAVDNCARARILRVSHECMTTRPHAIKEVCKMYHELKLAEFEILLDELKL